MDELDPTGLDRSALPAHIGIIMDGNGRWAKARGLERTQGHAAGEFAIFRTVDAALAIGVQWLTLYTFSTENWSRSHDEVEFLMLFNEQLIVKRREEMLEKGVRVLFLGDLDDPRIPDRNRLLMADTEELTAENDLLHLVFAFNYGGRRDIVEAARAIARAAAAGDVKPDDVDERSLAAHMGLPDMPDCDLVIRTSGEQRISNFLLWQAAYAELAFPDVLWPDFTGQHLVAAITEYQQRDRRFGAAG